MKIIPRVFKTRFRKIFPALLIVGAAMNGLVANGTETTDLVFLNLRFSHNGGKIVFDRCSEHTQECLINLYDLKTQSLSFYRPPPNQVWSMASFSPSGEKITFVVTPIKMSEGVKFRDKKDSQIAVMDVDGLNVRVITKSAGFKADPSFSWFEEKIIFIQAEKIRKAGSKTPASEYDVHEVYIASGVTQRVTNFHFFEMARPTYVLGDEKFVVHAGAPTQFPGLTKEESWEKYQKEFAFNGKEYGKYAGSKAYVMHSRQVELRPLFSDVNSASHPQLDAQGNFYFEAFDAKGLNIYRVDISGKRQYWPISGRYRTIWYRAVSPSGKYYAVIATPKEGGRFDRRLDLFEFANSKWSEISIPLSATQINQ